VNARWPTARRRSQWIKIDLLVDCRNVVDHTAMGRAPSMALLTIFMERLVSGSMMLVHARNEASALGTGIDSQRDNFWGILNLLFVAKRMTRWMAATPV